MSRFFVYNLSKQYLFLRENNYIAVCQDDTRRCFFVYSNIHITTFSYTAICLDVTNHRDVHFRNHNSFSNTSQQLERGVENTFYGVLLYNNQYLQKNVPILPYWV